MRERLTHETSNESVSWPAAEVDRIRIAAVLHDIGKLAVPPEILDKPTPLTSFEWRTVVQHPRIGQVILEQAAALKDALPTILHHHERFAGHGYPFGGYPVPSPVCDGRAGSRRAPCRRATARVAG